MSNDYIEARHKGEILSEYIANAVGTFKLNKQDGIDLSAYILILKVRLEQLQLDNAKLRATLRRYGKHDSCCGEIVTCVMPCDCGFHKALGETE